MAKGKTAVVNGPKNTKSKKQTASSTVSSGKKPKTNNNNKEVEKLKKSQHETNKKVNNLQHQVKVLSDDAQHLISDPDLVEPKLEMLRQNHLSQVAMASVEIAQRAGWNGKRLRDDANQTQAFFTNLVSTFTALVGVTAKLILMGSRSVPFLFRGLLCTFYANALFPTNMVFRRFFDDDAKSTDFLADGNRLSKKLRAQLQPGVKYCITPSLFSEVVFPNPTISYGYRINTFTKSTPNSSLVTYTTRDIEGNSNSTQRILDTEPYQGVSTTFTLEITVSTTTSTAGAIVFQAFETNALGQPNLTPLATAGATPNPNVYLLTVTKNWQSGQYLLITAENGGSVPYKIVNMEADFVRTTNATIDSMMQNPENNSFVQFVISPSTSNPRFARLTAFDATFTQITAELFKDGGVSAKIFNTIRDVDSTFDLANTSQAGVVETIDLTNGSFETAPFGQDYRFSTSTDIDNLPLRVLWMQPTTAVGSPNSFIATFRGAIERPTANTELAPHPVHSGMLIKTDPEKANSELSLISRKKKNVRTNDTHIQEIKNVLSMAGYYSGKTLKWLYDNKEPLLALGVTLLG